MRPPYDLDGVLGFLGARAIPGVERVDERGYARTVAIDRVTAVVEVGRASSRRGRSRGRGPRPRARDARDRRAAGRAAAARGRGARRVFDLAADPAEVGAAFRRDRLLSPLVRKRPGLRIAGAWDRSSAPCRRCSASR
ncbi:MAG: AlkA N-terminal domain-containing protein [Vicinamibacteria bacterium]